MEQGKTYMLRIINAALGNQLFFKVAGHSFTVVSVDASYTKPYKTDVVVLGPGQTVDALMIANAPPARYYMAAQAYISTAPPPPPRPPFDNTTTTGIVQYKSTESSSQHVTTTMPSFFDSGIADHFYTNLTSLIRPGDPTVPLHVDEQMFVVYGFGIASCQPGQVLCNQTQGALAARMNNVSFQSPTTMSLLEAHFKGINGIYTSDFPAKSPVTFDFTNASAVAALQTLTFTAKGTKLKKLKYNSTVEMVLQNTAILGVENHPMHLHGFNFFVLARGYGNYNATTAVKSYNLVDPQVRNTVGVPAGGWAVIRFTANNPGTPTSECYPVPTTNQNLSIFQQTTYVKRID